MHSRHTFATVQVERDRPTRSRLPLYPAVDTREIPFRLHAIECRGGWDHHRWLRLAAYAITFGWVAFALAASLWLLTWIPN